MKKGTNVGLDKNYDNVRVGDTIVAGDGSNYEINAYGMAVGSDGKAKKLSDIKDFTLKKQNDAPEKAAKKKLEEKSDKETSAPETAQPKGIEEYTNEELVAELRKRGWKVSCTKKVEKVIYKSIKI